MNRSRQRPMNCSLFIHHVPYSTNSIRAKRSSSTSMTRTTMAPSERRNWSHSGNPSRAVSMRKRTKMRYSVSNIRQAKLLSGAIPFAIGLRRPLASPMTMAASGLRTLDVIFLPFYAYDTLAG